MRKSGSKIRLYIQKVFEWTPQVEGVVFKKSYKEGNAFILVVWYEIHPRVSYQFEGKKEEAERKVSLNV
jgi:hypothetical protein